MKKTKYFNKNNDPSAANCCVTVKVKGHKDEARENLKRLKQPVSLSGTISQDNLSLTTKCPSSSAESSET